MLQDNSSQSNKLEGKEMWPYMFVSATGSQFMYEKAQKIYSLYVHF